MLRVAVVLCRSGSVQVGRSAVVVCRLWLWHRDGSCNGSTVEMRV